jgi:hypothetical protein
LADTGLTDDSLVQVYKVYIGDVEYDIGPNSVLPAQTKTVDIEISIGTSGGATPILSGLNVQYQSA